MVTESVPLRVSATPIGATLKGGKWTPRKDASGNILQAEWDGLPPSTFIEWMGTSLESQLSPPFGAAAGYLASGSNPTGSHYGAFTGMGFDEATGRCYHFGGGHADGSNNMLTCFDAAKGAHSVVIPPTNSSAYPAGYFGNQNLGELYYPGSQKKYQYFPAAETPAGDNAPCANHEYAGIVFVPGINEVLLPRFGWFHAQLESKTWRVGPQTTDANRKGFKNRGGISFQSHYLPSTGLVYMTSEGGQINDNAAYFTIIKYNPVTRVEVGAIPFNAATWESSSCLIGDTLWRFNSDSGGSVMNIGLKTEVQAMKRTPYSGRKPGWGDGDNPVQYVSHLDKLLMWVTRSLAGGAQAGEMLEFNRSTLAFGMFPVAGTPPTAPPNGTMENKMRYWPAKKVMLFQLRTSTNCWLMKLA